MRTQSDAHLDYLVVQDRRITLPVRFVAASLWTWATSVDPDPWWTSPIMASVVIIAWVSLVVHAYVTARVSSRETIRSIYLGFTVFDTVLLAFLIADTGGALSPWAFAVPLQQIRFLKGTLSDRRWTWLGLAITLMWFVPVIWVDGPSVILSTRFIVMGSLMIFVYISASQVVLYLNSIYYSQVSLKRQLEAEKADKNSPK